MTYNQANLMQVSMICMVHEESMFHTEHNKSDCNLIIATLLLFTNEINTPLHPSGLFEL